MKEPLVSIILPVYGVEDYIEKCIRSIFEQTYVNLEIIIVDDCTPDDSINIIKSILEEYPHRKSQVQIIKNSKNLGLAGARLTGLKHSNGEYIQNLDSDDFVEKEMIEQMVSLALHENADITICDINLIRKGQTTHLSVNPSLNPIECLKQVLKCIVHSSVANKLIKKDLYTSHNIQPIIGLNMREDLSVMYRLLFFAKKLAYIPQPFYNYMLRDNSISSSRMNNAQQNNSQDLIFNMNTFCEAQKIKDKKLLQAFSFFKALIKTDILIYGDIKNLNSNLYKNLNYKHYITHPKLSIYQKIIGLISEIPCEPLLILCRKIIDKIKK